MEMFPKHLCINIPALHVPLFLFPVGIYQNKSLDLSRMIPVAVDVLYCFLNNHSIIQHYDFIYLSLKVAFKSSLMWLNTLLDCPNFFFLIENFSFHVLKHLNPNIIIGHLSKVLWFNLSLGENLPSTELANIIREGIKPNVNISVFKMFL